MMVDECGTSRAGLKHYHYKCGNAKRRTGGDKKAVRKQWIEDLVVEHTMRMILNDTVVNDVAALVVQAQDRENTDLPALQNQPARRSGTLKICSVPFNRASSPPPPSRGWTSWRRRKRS